MHERDVELGGEALRFMDLVRWSSLEEPWFDLNTLNDFTVGEDEYLPVIQPEIENLGSFLNNGAKDSLTTFSVPQLPDYSSISYSLTSGDGDDDNSKFYIENNILFAHDPLYYDEQKDYNILVKAEDDFGGFTTGKFRFRIMEPSSVPHFESFIARVWPNPVSGGILNIESEGAAEIFLYNIHGKLIKRREIQGNESLNVESIDRGIYILRMDSFRGSNYFRIVIQ
jgi:hypothetical protein